jgi:chitin disaccharide deacetylase
LGDYTRLQNHTAKNTFQTMKKPIRTSLLTIVFCICLASGLQGQGTLAEKLGFEPDAKLLIVHADDIGLSSSVNQAAIRAFESGGITSGSIMVPCPWFGDFAAYARKHPAIDVGIHLTLTAEWDLYKWDGVEPSSKIPSLLDEMGYFYPTVEQVASHADPAEAEIEARAQIERALAFGIRPTHIDTHMGSIAATPELFQVYVTLGKEYGLPLLLPRNLMQQMPGEIARMVEEEFILLDGLFMIGAVSPGITWAEQYKGMIKNMKPGLNQLIVHLGFDDQELRAITGNTPFGSAWRQRDLDYVTSSEFRELLEKNNIHLVGWKQIQEIH